MNTQDKQKQIVGEKAISYIQEGMKVGLGTGSTMYFALKALGERVSQGLQIAGIPTSNTTAEWAKQFGIPLTDFSETDRLDIAIDGADEVDPNLQLIKGGGGALLREKIVADAADEFIVIVDESKLVSHLGKFPLPIEVIPFGWESTAKKVSTLGCEVALRQVNGEIFVTDNGNYILDCSFDKIEEPNQIHRQLSAIVGVVETGLFTNMTSKVLVGKSGTVEVIDK